MKADALGNYSQLVNFTGIIEHLFGYGDRVC